MGIIVVLLFILWAFFPSPEKKARIVAMHLEVKKVAEALEQQTVETGNLTNINNRLILQAIFGTNDLFRDYYSERTNSQGEVLDYWRTPYQIEILAQTNFIVRSAGPNKKFGDADDIIFNSVSNDFVKP